MDSGNRALTISMGIDGRGFVVMGSIMVASVRDGNDRCARLLALLMAFQAGLPPLDFSGWSGRGERNYIAAVHAAVGSDYEPMVGLFSEVIRRSYDRFGRRGG